MIFPVLYLLFLFCPCCLCFVSAVRVLSLYVPFLLPDCPCSVPDVPVLSLLSLFCPCISLLVPAWPCFVPACPCLIPACPCFVPACPSFVPRHMGIIGILHNSQSTPIPICIEVAIANLFLFLVTGKITIIWIHLDQSGYFGIHWN